ncbi:MAG: hypothetical protein HY002_21895 [Candidatus Rokubacteria bacterium]|nr:hypothetical protein [Candidatus Rokubacteria bacterium]
MRGWAAALFLVCALFPAVVGAQVYHWVDSLEVGSVSVGPLPIIVHDADLKQTDGLFGRDPNEAEAVVARR